MSLPQTYTAQMTGLRGPGGDFTGDLVLSERAPETVKSFGAKGDGVSATEDTAGIGAALAKSALSRAAIPQAWMVWNTRQDQYGIPPGTYDAGDFVIAGGDTVLWALVPGTVVIRIPDGKYFSEVVGVSDNVICHGIRFVGGKGVFKASQTSGNVRGFQLFSNSIFDSYTECAIQNAANDHPYLRVYDCMFGGKSGEQTIGIAWGGYLDACAIQGNLFMRNAYHIKLGGGVNGISGSFFVEKNDFICLLGRDSDGNILPEPQQTRTLSDVWIVGVKAVNGFGVNSGFGSSLSRNKFGNENQIAGNERILFAPELQADIDAGKPRGAIMPDRTWTTTTTIGGSTYTHIFSGLSIEDNLFNSVSPQTGPVIRSYIPEVRGIKHEGNDYAGGQHTYFIEFMGVRSPSYVNTDWDIEVKAGGISAKGSPFQFGFANYPVGPIRDPGGNMPFDPMALLAAPVSDDAGYALLRDVTVAANWSATDATKTTYNNIYGASEGVEATLTAPGGSLNSVLATMPANKLAWVQLLLSQGSANSVGYVWVDVVNFSTLNVVARKYYRLTSATPISAVFSFVTPDDGAATWQIRVWSGDYNAATKTTFRVEGGFVNLGKRPAQIGNFGTAGSAAWNAGAMKLGPKGYVFLDDTSTGTTIQWPRFLFSSNKPTAANSGLPFSFKVSVPTTVSSPGYPGNWACDGSFTYFYTGNGMSTGHAWRRVAVGTW